MLYCQLGHAEDTNILEENKRKEQVICGTDMTYTTCMLKPKHGWKETSHTEQTDRRTEQSRGFQ